MRATTPFFSPTLKPLWTNVYCILEGENIYYNPNPKATFLHFLFSLPFLHMSPYIVFCFNSLPCFSGGFPLFMPFTCIFPPNNYFLSIFQLLSRLLLLACPSSETFFTCFAAPRVFSTISFIWNTLWQSFQGEVCICV